MAKAAAALVDEGAWGTRRAVGIYPLGAWGEIIADENSIVGQSRAPARVTVTDTPGIGIRTGSAADQMMGLLSASHSKEAHEFARFFFENVLLAGSVLARIKPDVDPFEFEPVAPKERRLVSVTVRSMGRAAAPRFEE